MTNDPLERLRRLCLRLPDTTERLSHAMVDSDPIRFFRPPYVGHRGWLGVRVDVEVDWDEVETIVRDAYAMVAR